MWCQLRTRSRPSPRQRHFFLKAPTKLGWQRHLVTQSLSLRTRTRSTSTSVATSPRGILNTWLRRISRNTTFEIGLGVIASNKEMNVYELRYFNIAENNGRGEKIQVLYFGSAIWGRISSSSPLHLKAVLIYIPIPCLLFLYISKSSQVQL